MKVSITKKEGLLVLDLLASTTNRNLRNLSRKIYRQLARLSSGRKQVKHNNVLTYARFENIMRECPGLLDSIEPLSNDFVSIVDKVLLRWRVDAEMAIHLRRTLEATGKVYSLMDIALHVGSPEHIKPRGDRR